MKREKLQARKPRLYRVIDRLDGNVFWEFHANNKTEAYERALEQVGFTLSKVREN